MRRRGPALALLALALAAALLLQVWAPASAQRFWLDRQLRLASPSTPPPGVLVVDIDEASLSTLRAQGLSWPLPRDVYALLIEALRDAGASAIVLDLVFDDARAGDVALSRALQRPGAPVLLAAAALPQLRQEADAPPRWAALIGPQAALGVPTERLGLVSQMLDADGRLREWRLWHETPLGRLPLMPLAVLRALGEAPADLDAQALPLLLGAPPLQRPLAPLLAAAREGRSAELATVHGRIVFIGASGSLADKVLSPWGQRQGTALLAGATAALKAQQWLRPLPLPWSLLAGVTGALPLFALLLRGGRAQAGAALGWSLLGLALLAVLFLALSHAGLRFDPGPALLLLGIALLGETLLRLWQQRREAERLRHAQQLAKGAQQAKVALLGAVSDELRTPLAAVLGLAELLQQGGEAGLQQRRAALLARASERLDALVDDLLDFNRLELGGEAAQPQAFELAPLLAEAVAQAQARRGPSQRVLVDVLPAPDVPPWLMGDARRLGQVLAALLTNALTFTPVGRVSLRVQGDEREGHLQFVVSDTGIGIAPSQLSRLFDPLAAEAALREGSAGLALAAARQRVRLLGGEIDATSVPGAGSRFAFSLPLPACDPTPAVPEPDVALAGRRLLLAEDDELAAEVLGAQLGALGLQVERAGNGHLALALLQRLGFDWVLVDLHLSGQDGLAVLRRLREHELAQRATRTPVLVLAAQHDPALAAHCRELGADALLVKPISQHQLAVALRAAAAPQAVPGGPRLAPPLLPENELSRLQAHAQVFLGHWGSHWAQADAAQREALLRDLRDCAVRLKDEALDAAAHSGNEQRVAEAVEAALARLRGFSS